MPDFVEFEGERCELECSWEYPSPLEVYFTQKEEKSPFEWIHTANYRGHVAEWLINDDSLFLKRITREDKELKISDYLEGKQSPAFCDWFSGVAWIKRGKYKNEHADGSYHIGFKEYVFLEFENGKIKERTVLKEEEYTKAVSDYFERRESDDPVTEGPIVRFAEYINSFKQI